MELHALDRMRAVSDTHDLVPGPVFLPGPGRDLQRLREARLRDYQGVVARGLEGYLQPGEYTLSLMIDERGLAVHYLPCLHDAAAECLADGLVAKTHAEDGNAPGKRPDQGHGDPGLVGGAGSGGDNDVRGGKVRDLLQTDAVVTEDPHFDAQFAQILDQIEGEGVVVVDHQQHRQSPSAAVGLYLPSSL